MPRVSIIIPTQNRSNLLLKAIDSVLGQTFQDFECIVIDDASIDDTPTTLVKYKSNEQFLIHHIKNSKGANYARNQGLKRSSGEYISFLDDDDFLLPTKIERQVKLLDKMNGATLASCWYRKRMKIQAPPPEIALSILLRDNVVGGFSVGMFRKSDIDILGGLDESLRNAQDWDYWLRLASRGKMFCVQECLVEYNTSSPGRITDQTDRNLHYKNYMRVVKRNEKKMNPLTRLRHHCTAVFFTTSASRPYLKIYRGAWYYFVRALDQITAYIS